MELTATEKIRRARSLLQVDNPFFAYLVLHLNLIESKEVPSMGVNEAGDMAFNPEFVKKLTDDEMKGVVCHEVMHVALLHLSRIIDKNNAHLWNIAVDLVVNDMLITEGLNLPKGALLPQNHTMTVGTTAIHYINKKVAEEIYYELAKNAKKFPMITGFDAHEMGGKGDDGTGSGNDKLGNGKAGASKELTTKTDWGKVLAEAATFAKMQGKLPAGMERLVDNALNSKINWKSLLYKYITSNIRKGYTYSRPNRRYISQGLYMPDMKRENVEVVVAVDTSGSIGKEEIEQFTGEMLSIAKSFKSVKMTILACDAKVNDVIEVTRHTSNDIMNFSFKGGGGTSHEPVFKWLDENKPNAKVIICLTDGYTTAPKEVSYNTIWVITKGGSDDAVKGIGKVIRMEE